MAPPVRSARGPPSIDSPAAVGVFCVAMDPARREVGYEKAVALTGPAGARGVE